METLIFGGLNPLGSHIISYFLEEGVETRAVKSNMRGESEEEHEMFFGRNALFKSVEIDEREDIEHTCSTACFLGLTYKGNQKEAIENLEKLLLTDDSLEKVILIFGRPQDESVPKKKNSSIDLQEAFEKQIRERNEHGGSVQLFILHTPFDDVDEAAYSGKDARRTSFAKCVFELTQLDCALGVHEYHLEENNEEKGEEKQETSNFKLVKKGTP